MKKITYLIFGLALLGNLYASARVVYSHRKCVNCIDKINYVSLKNAMNEFSKAVNDREI